jgi:hypothetical protein
MATLQKAEFAPNSRIVIKNTFVECEARSQSRHDLLEEGRHRSSSDSILYESGTAPGPIKMLSADEDITLTGLSDDDVEGCDQPTRSTSACSDIGDLPSTSDPEASEAVSEAPKRGHLDRLASENARLQKENEMLRQQCLEVAMAAQQAAAATSKAAMKYCEPSDELQHGGDADATPSNMMRPVQGPQPSPVEPACSEDCRMVMMPMGTGNTQMALMPAMRQGLDGTPIFTPGMPFPDMRQCFWVPLNCATSGVPVMQGPAVMFPMQKMGDEVNGMACTYDPNMVQQRLPERRQNSTFGQHRQTWSNNSDVADEIAIFDHQDSECFVPEACRTTVMLRNLPNNYSRAMMLELIDKEGFAGLYDFIYLPIDFKSRASLGYCFINLVNHEAASRFRATFDGYSDWILPSRKVCGISWSGPHQGLEAHIERYRNSPVMHEAVPDMYRPAIFQDGVRMHFPPATKKLRAPRIRQFTGPGTGFFAPGMTRN